MGEYSHQQHDWQRGSRFRDGIGERRPHFWCKFLSCKALPEVPRQHVKIRQTDQAIAGEVTRQPIEPGLSKRPRENVEVQQVHRSVEIRIAAGGGCAQSQARTAVSLCEIET